MKIAVIGAGRIGQIHAKNIAENPLCQLVGINDFVETAASTLAQKLNTKVLSIDAIMGDKTIEAIAICSPTDTHADLIEMAASAGKAIFCEKPIDLASKRVKDCLKTVEKHKTKLMIGFNRRFDPQFAEFKARLSQGIIGNMEMLTILSRDSSPPPVDYVKRSGGIFRDMMVHDLDCARFMTGEEMVSVYAVGSSLVDPNIGAAGDFDTAAVTLKTSSGKIIQISNSRRATYGYDQRLEAHGEKGLLKTDNLYKSSITLANQCGFTQDPVLDFFLDRYNAAYKLELNAFITALKTGSKLSPTGEDGLRAQELADAATESANTGKVVHF